MRQHRRGGGDSGGGGSGGGDDVWKNVSIHRTDGCTNEKQTNRPKDGQACYRVACLPLKSSLKV